MSTASRSRKRLLERVYFLRYVSDRIALPFNRFQSVFTQGNMILIVDDQKDTGAVLARLLRYAGHESGSVMGGAEALAMLHIRKPALLVLDVSMPDMDGLTVLRTIKEDDELNDVRVVMYSADTRKETRAEATRLGAVDFLAKGTTGFDNLIARIADLAGEPMIAA